MSSLSGDVRKAIVALAPSFNTPANRSAIRSLLVERGFVIIRDEARKLHREAAAVLLGDISASRAGETALTALTAGGECQLLVVARADVFAQLQELMSQNSLEGQSGLYVSPLSDPKAAATQLAKLFPRVHPDALPSTAEARDFVQIELKTLLVEGLTQLAKSKPEEPVKALADWLLEHNPHRPKAKA